MNNRNAPARNLLICICLATLLSACGGSGGGSSAAPGSSTTTTTTSTTTTSIAPNGISPAFVTHITAMTGASTTVTLDPSTSTDSQGTISVYAVAWGDGQTSSSLTSGLQTHTYTSADATAASNTYQVTLTLTDSHNHQQVVTNPLVVPLGRVTTSYNSDIMATIPISNQIVSLSTTMVVPPQPVASGTLAIWPALLPVTGGANYNPTGYGILQPVLVWGGVGAQTTTLSQSNYGTWWVEGYYYNTLNGGTSSGGALLSVNVGDTLHMTMTLNGQVWTQTITDVTLGQTVAFSNTLAGQAQNLINFAVEEKGASAGPRGAVTYTNTTVTLANAQAGNWCNPTQMGASDSISAPVISLDTKTCTISSLTLTPGVNNANMWNSAP